MSDPNFDGLCGIPWRYPLQDGSYIRCRLYAGHHGKHDWEKYPEDQRAKVFRITPGVPSRTYGNIMKRLVLMKPEEYARHKKEK